MNVQRAGSVALLAVVMLFGSAAGSESVVVEVFQPQGDPNGIFLSAVSYVGYFGGPGPGREVALTCEPNSVPNPWGAPININLAAEGHFKLTFLPGRGTSGSDGDTLRVALNVAPVDTMRVVRIGVLSPDSIVVATVECLMANAARASDRTHFVALRVEGRRGLEKYGGVYPTLPYRCGPRRKVM